jgi:hypothetical protein
MVSKKQEITLIVKRNAMPSFILRIVGEQSSERTAYLQTQARIKVVQDYFWLVFREPSAVFYLI